MRSKVRLLSTVATACALLIVLLLAFAGVLLAASDIIIDGDFADWTDGDGNEFCVDDEGGNNDRSPSRFDITKFCVASDESDTLYLLFGFEDTTLTGGANSTACVLIDTDSPPNGYYDYTLCVVLKGPGSTSVQSVTLYTCDDTSGSGCSGPSSSKTYASSSYGFDNTESGPWDDDSLLELALPFSDLGVTSGNVIFSALSSFPDESTLTAFKDSIFEDTNKRVRYDLGAGSGSITGPTAITLVYFLARSASSVVPSLLAWLVSGALVGIAVLSVIALRIRRGR